MCTRETLALHIVQSQRTGITVLAQPQTGKIQDILSAHETAQLYPRPRKVHGNRTAYDAECSRGIVSPIETHRPMARMNDGFVSRNGPGRVAEPATRQAIGERQFESENVSDVLFGVFDGIRLGRPRQAEGQGKADPAH